MAILAFLALLAMPQRLAFSTHAMTRSSASRVVRSRPAAGARVAADRQRAAAAQHFLANRHADPFLELEAHQRHRPVEHVGGAIHVCRRGTGVTILTRISGNANPVIAPVAPAISSSSRNTPPRPPKIRTLEIAGLVENPRRLERGWRIFELDGPRARDLPGDARQQPRLHRVAGDRRIVLHDDLDVHRFGERAVVPHHRLGVELRHPRRTDHDRGGAGRLRLAAVTGCRSACRPRSSPPRCRCAP